MTRARRGLDSSVTTFSSSRQSHEDLTSNNQKVMPRMKATRFVFCLSSLVTLIFCAFTIWTTTDVRTGIIHLTGRPFGGRYVSGRKPLTTDPEESREISRMFWSTLKFKPWFTSGGFLRPDSQSDVYQKLAVWPDQDPDSDRIANQLMYLPPGYDAQRVTRNKKIFLFYGHGGWNARDLPMGQTRFLRDKCPVSTCELTSEPEDMETADAVFFKDRFQWPTTPRPLNQIWILFLLECPSHTQSFARVDNAINWTATYRHDSDIVAPYEKFFHLTSSSETSAHYEDSPDDSESDDKVTNADRFEPLSPADASLVRKKPRVAWFVSNCGAQNRRLEYAHELSRYIQVDIFGTCGTKRCPRSRQKECFSLLNTTYKYYLAFENSNCRDYMTEKFFVNGLMNNILPIVMGAHPHDYRRSSPPHSFIHVDDFPSPKALAHFLLHMDDHMYDSYFAWKRRASGGEFINTYFWCRVCAMLHSPRAERESHSYADLQSWWTRHGQSSAHVCQRDGWRRGVPHSFLSDSYQTTDSYSPANNSQSASHPPTS